MANADGQRRAHRGDQLDIPRRLSGSVEDLVRADRELAEYVQRVRLDNEKRRSLRPRTRGFVPHYIYHS